MKFRIEIKAEGEIYPCSNKYLQAIVAGDGSRRATLNKLLGHRLGHGQI